MTDTQTYKAFLVACGLWAAGPTPAGSAPFDTFKDCDVCPEMIELPLGEFMMGAPEGESQLNFHWDENGWRPATADDPFIAHQEGPVHKVTVDTPFAIGRNEVTYDEWMACVNDGGCKGYTPDSTVVLPATRGLHGTAQATGNHPVINVSFIDIRAYANWLNENVGSEVYRLPTEAEW